MTGTARVVAATGVSLSYGDTLALDNVSLTLAAGQAVALMGSSGSGKSSLLHCLSGVLVPDTGEIDVLGVRLNSLSERARSNLRLTSMGMVFQFGNLIPELTLR